MALKLFFSYSLRDFPINSQETVLLNFQIIPWQIQIKFQWL